MMGLTGEQGVIIPEKNLKNLMLRQEVVDAVRKGTFHIYATKTVDEGIEILTGVKGGTRHKDGSYPQGSINGMVQKRLKEMAFRLQEFSQSPKKNDKKKQR